MPKNVSPKQEKFCLLQAMPITDQTFERLLIDSVGDFNHYNFQKKYLHIIINNAARCIYAFLSRNVNAETYINCLKQVFSLQILQKVFSDPNVAFTSSKFRRFH